MGVTFSPNLLLRAVLFIAGCAIVFLGLNVGLGGIQTLGWQGADDFISITDPHAFAVHDNHVRFIGGVWLGLGFLMMAGAFALRRLRMVIIALIGMIFVGGLARISAWDAGTLLDAAIVPSFVLEILLFPLLGLWVATAEGTAPTASLPA